jgi:hypothetical protein
MPEQDIINFLKINGPVTPVQYAKHVNTSLLFASAMLGEISSKGNIKTSHLKIGGGSPLYYLKEHEEQLQKFTNNLDSKDKKAYDLLLEKKVLRDKEQIPIIRISLRAIKDFAIPINIIKNNESELFWKWYMTSDEEAKKIIQNIFQETQEDIKKENINIKDDLKKENNIHKKDEVKEINQNKDKNENIENNTNIKENINNNDHINNSDNKIQDSMKKNDKLEEQSEIINNDEIKIKKEDIISNENEKQNDNNKNNIIDSNQNKSNNKLKITDNHKIEEFNINKDLNVEFSKEVTNNLGKKIINYLNDKEIKIIKYNLIKKNKEYNMVLEVPSVIGKAKFFCKITDKKRITEGDLALALVEGQNKQLPVLFLTTGKLNKKTEELKDILFKDINYVNL